MTRWLHSSSSMTYYPHPVDPEVELQKQRRRVSDPYASAELLDHYAMDPDLCTKYKVAKHPNTSEKTLLTMVKDKEKKVPVLVAQHPKSTAEVLRKLVMSSNDKYVWRNVAWHPNVTPGTLEMLAHKDDYVTLIGVLKNAKTSNDTLFMLAEHENEKVRQMAMARLRRLPTKGVVKTPAKPVVTQPEKNTRKGVFY